MKVFISWSGTRGLHVATVLREWLPLIIQGLEPWTSNTDIGPGERWSQAIANQLGETTFGIVCVTKESRLSPWILFEAGALAKSVNSARVCPYLIDMNAAELGDPLNQFQAVAANREGTLRLVRAIYAAHPNPLVTEQNLQRTFDRFWHELEDRLAQLPDTDLQAPLRSDRVLLEEVLDHVRSLSLGQAGRRVTNLDHAASEYRLEIDLSGLGVQPRLVTVPVDAATRFQDFLDRVYVEYLHDIVPPYTYGKTWILVDRSGKRVAKDKKGEKRTLSEAGLSAETSELAAISLIEGS